MKFGDSNRREVKDDDSDVRVAMRTKLPRATATTDSVPTTFKTVSFLMETKLCFK
jgi:hypothetical protein